MALFNPRRGQWWNEPPERIKLAYYMTLRVHYEMGALEAWNYMKEARRKYPEFMDNPIGQLRQAIFRERGGEA